MKKILVPTDFSPASQHSFQFACDAASAVNGEVFVVHMIEFWIAQQKIFGIQQRMEDQQALDRLKRAALDRFAEMKNAVAPKVPVHFEALDKDVVPGILSYIKHRGIDHVIMSTHGASDLDEFFMGSTAEKIARFSPVPVIAIPKTTAFRQVRDILFPNTFELDQQSLVRQIKALQETFNARLHLLYINTPYHFHSDKDMRNLMEDFARHYQLTNYQAHWRSDFHESKGIVEFVRHNSIDMVAMATHGRIGLANLFKGSVAESVLNQIEIPIWTHSLRSR